MKLLDFFILKNSCYHTHNIIAYIVKSNEYTVSFSNLSINLGQISLKMKGSIVIHSIRTNKSEITKDLKLTQAN